MSGGSSIYGSTTEEQRQINELRRLKRELAEAREQVISLSSQLSTSVSKDFLFQILTIFVEKIIIKVDTNIITVSLKSDNQINLLEEFS